MNQLENIAHQAENAVRTQLTRGAAEVMRDTSIVNASARALGQAQKTVGSTVKKSGVYTKSSANAQQYIEADTAYATARSVPVFDIPSPGIPRRGDRLSPVQEIRTAKGYYRRQVKRVIGGVLLVGIIVAAAIILLYHWGY